MKKIFKTCCALALIVALTLTLAACGGGTATPIAYTGGTLESGKVGQSYSASVATATGPDKIYYELKNGEWLPEGLDLNENGEIFGTPSEAVRDYEFTVVAYADVETPDVEAKFSITVEAGQISAEGRDLKTGKAYEMYADTLFELQNRNEKLTYKLKENAALPAGLKVTEDGFLIGTPTETAENQAFTVTVSGEGYADADIYFQVSVTAGEKPAAGTVISYTGTALPDATVGELYYGSVATATGAENITYKRTYIGGVGFPTGLAFDACGLVYGIPADSTNGEDNVLSFYSAASADGYASVRQTFTLRVLDREAETKQFEAEYINLTGKQGAGYSSSPSGKGLVQEFADASNGASVGFLLTEISLDFVVYAKGEIDGATLEISLASEIGNVTFTPEQFEIRVNGVVADYGTLSLTGGQQVKGEFQLKKVTDALRLQEGKNVITVSVKANTLRGGSTGGPIIDFLRVSGTDVTTSWRPKVSNYTAVRA